MDPRFLDLVTRSRWRFTHGERAPGTHWIGGWVDPRAGLGDVEKLKCLTLPGLELQPVARRYTDCVTAARF
jgi:hypothetical protein